MSRDSYLLTKLPPINPACFQRLTYEEKMARRLLGADNAATVFNTQQTDEESATQVQTGYVCTNTYAVYVAPYI